MDILLLTTTSFFLICLITMSLKTEGKDGTWVTRYMNVSQKANYVGFQVLNSFQSINSYTLDPSKTLNYCENVKLHSQNVITCAQNVSKYSQNYMCSKCFKVQSWILYLYPQAGYNGFKWSDSYFKSANTQALNNSPKPQNSDKRHDFLWY